MNRLKELRLENGLLQSDIAKVIKTSDRAVGFYENGQRDMSPEIISILSDFFNVSTDYFLMKTEIRNIEELKKVQFANAGGLDVNGLDEDELLELQKQIDFMKWRKNKNK